MKKKLKLDADSLRVESFESSHENAGTGTVRGLSWDTFQDDETCSGGDPCVTAGGDNCTWFHCPPE